MYLTISPHSLQILIIIPRRVLHQVGDEFVDRQLALVFQPFFQHLHVPAGDELNIDGGAGII